MLPTNPNSHPYFLRHKLCSTKPYEQLFDFDDGSTLIFLSILLVVSSSLAPDKSAEFPQSNTSMTRDWGGLCAASMVLLTFFSQAPFFHIKVYKTFAFISIKNQAWNRVLPLQEYYLVDPYIAKIQIMRQRKVMKRKGEEMKQKRTRERCRQIGEKI